MKHNRSPQKNQLGQSTIELVLVLLLIMGSSMIFVKTALMMAYGNYIQYVTFMAARTMMAGHHSLNEQRNNAIRVLEYFLQKEGNERFAILGKGKSDVSMDANIAGLQIVAKPRAPSGKGTFNNRSLAWYEGIAYTFASKIITLPLGKKASLGEAEVNLTSEAWLGREPTVEECKAWLKAEENLGKGKVPGNEGEYLDNGC